MPTAILQDNGVKTGLGEQQRVSQVDTTKCLVSAMTENGQGIQKREKEPSGFLNMTENTTIQKITLEDTSIEYPP